MDYRLLLLSSLIATINVFAVPQLSSPHLELTHYIKRCDAASFKNKFAELATQCQNNPEKIALLDLYYHQAQEKKAEKLATLEQIQGRHIQNRTYFYKAAVQVCGMVFLSVCSIIAIGKGFCDPEFARTNTEETGGARCAALVLVPLTVWLGSLTKHTISQTLHYSDTIKKDIEALDEIITFINQTRVRCHILTYF